MQTISSHSFDNTSNFDLHYRMLTTDPISMIFLAVIFVISISLHEYAHAWASTKLGDPTPKMQWRLTPNPLVHIDLLGFVLIFLINFGRWRPVIINPNYYKNKIRDELLVALAWPASNILLCFLGSLILMIYVKFNGWATYFNQWDLIVQFWQMFAILNAWLAVFNLIPLPPLDGYRIIKFIKPMRWYWLEKHIKVIWIVLLAIILLPTPLRDVFHVIISKWALFVYWIVHTLVTILIW